MNGILLTFTLTYGGQYLCRYLANKVTDKIVNKGYDVAKKSAKNAWENISGSVKTIDVEYEFVQFDLDEKYIDEPIIYVTSVPRRKSIDQSWDSVSATRSTILYNPSTKEFMCEMNEESSYTNYLLNTGDDGGNGNEQNLPYVRFQSQ